MNHKSDCAVHNEPAFPKGKCDCGFLLSKEEMVDLIEDALGALTRIECDCGRSLDISRYIDRKDIEDWLEKRGKDIILDKDETSKVK